MVNDKMDFLLKYEDVRPLIYKDNKKATVVVLKSDIRGPI